MRYEKRTTIKDIALLTKLSPSTVSRALNKNPNISDKTKKKVLQAAKKMDYKPNLNARGLVKSKTFLMGLLIYDVLNPFYAELSRAIQDTAEEAGYWIIQASTYDDAEKTEMLVESMFNIGVDGLIFASCRLEDFLVENLIDNGFPVVQVNRRLKKDKGNQIVLDNAYGAYLAVSHLIRLGYKRIGMIGGPIDLSTSVGRYEGYFEALAEKGLKIDEAIVKRGSFFSQDTGYEFTKRLMRLIDPPEAIFCADDYIALGSMRALGEMEVKIPEDVAVVGYDDIELSSHPLIQLTSVNQDVHKMGRLATKNIIDRIAGKSSSEKRIVLEPHLIIRKSCGYQLKTSK